MNCYHRLAVSQEPYPLLGAYSLPHRVKYTRIVPRYQRGHRGSGRVGGLSRAPWLYVGLQEVGPGDQEGLPAHHFQSQCPMWKAVIRPDAQGEMKEAGLAQTWLLTTEGTTLLPQSQAAPRERGKT